MMEVKCAKTKKVNARPKWPCRKQTKLLRSACEVHDGAELRHWLA